MPSTLLAAGAIVLLIAWSSLAYAQDRSGGVERIKTIGFTVGDIERAANSPTCYSGDDASIRPNRRHLLTAYGLRSLAPGSPAYHPHYGGGVLERDGGYHQGPVWSWLLGPFCLATYRVGGNAGAAQEVLAAISDALEDQAVGTIGEIFDGDPPHQPRGAPVQAWSVACTLDAWRLLREAGCPRLSRPVNEALESITHGADC